jgi:hypothetical protein
MSNTIRMQRYLAHRKLEELGQYGREQSRRLGYTEADVPRLIAKSRRGIVAVKAFPDHFDLAATS